jgi:hypothetical protein
MIDINKQFISKSLTIKYDKNNSCAILIVNEV